MKDIDHRVITLMLRKDERTEGRTEGRTDGSVIISRGDKNRFAKMLKYFRILKKKIYYQKSSAIFVILITFLDTKAILIFAAHNQNGR